MSASLHFLPAHFIFHPYKSQGSFPLLLLLLFLIQVKNGLDSCDAAFRHVLKFYSLGHFFPFSIIRFKKVQRLKIIFFLKGKLYSKVGTSRNMPRVLFNSSHTFNNLDYKFTSSKSRGHPGTFLIKYKYIYIILNLSYHIKKKKKGKVKLRYLDLLSSLLIVPKLR